MMTGGLGVLESSSPPADRRGSGGALRIVCPTYWYPSHAADTNATYVHDINRHLVRRGHAVRVVTPRSAGGAPREAFDGVEVVRFPLEVPDDLSYGHVAQTKVGLAGSPQRLGVM